MNHSKYKAHTNIILPKPGTNCIHGVQSRCGSDCASLFPEPNCLGSTFNKTLISNISAAIGLELRALWLQGIGENHASNLPHLGLDCWSPTINIGRDPRWGRMYEIPSEDPYWNGVYGKYYTLGLQNGSSNSKYYDPRYYQAITTLKHFDAYSMEDYGNVTRIQFNAVVSDYMFSDTYLPAFKMAIVEGGAKGIMCACNSINGVPGCANNFLLKQKLRDEWNFTGYITSDSNNIYNIWATHNYTKTLQEAVYVALNATCDIDSYLGTTLGGISDDYGTSSAYQSQIVEMVNNNQINISYVDKALYNSLRLRFELGLFDPIQDQPYWKVPGSVVNSKEHQDLNLFAARSGMTLLKNDGDILPFPSMANKKFAVIGPHYNASANLLLQGAYTGQVCRDNTFKCVPGILNMILKYVNDKDLTYSQGCDIDCTSTAGFQDAINTAKNADYVLLMMGIDRSIEGEGHDRTNISLPGYQQNLASEICKLGKPTVLVLINGGIVAIDELKYDCPSILEAWYPGFRGAEGVMGVIFGEYNPGGKMAVTMYWSNYTTISNYTEYDLTKGYGKTYKYWNGVEPLFTFGYGLSYTQFKFTKNNTCQVPDYCIDIENIGNREGRETIFVFIYPPNNISSMEPASRMRKHLIEFDKFYLEKGDKIVYKYTLDKSKDLILYDVNGNPVIYKGKYKLEMTNGVNQYESFEISV